VFLDIVQRIQSVLELRQSGDIDDQHITPDIISSDQDLYVHAEVQDIR
jgi:hypothetical protein